MEAQVNALIIVAIALVAVGLLITVILWLRTPDAAESEYVTVAELRARLEDEQEPGDRTDEQNRSESAESPPEQDEPEPDDTAAAASAVSPGGGTRPAAQSTPGSPSDEKPANDIPGDESEIHGPTPEQAPDSGGEAPTGEAGRDN
ncbi:hypothetical protein [Nocardia sp. NPDC003963]